jgi:hypothetical protein
LLLCVESAAPCLLSCSRSPVPPALPSSCDPSLAPMSTNAPKSACCCCPQLVQGRRRHRSRFRPSNPSARCRRRAELVHSTARSTTKTTVTKRTDPPPTSVEESVFSQRHVEGGDAFKRTTMTTITTTTTTKAAARTRSRTTTKAVRSIVSGKARRPRRNPPANTGHGELHLSHGPTTFD